MMAEPRLCLGCGAPLIKRRKESVGRFAERRYCAQSCRELALGHPIAAPSFALGRDRDVLPCPIDAWRPEWRFVDITPAERLTIARQRVTRVRPDRQAIPALTMPTPEYRARMRVLDAAYAASPEARAAFA